MDKYFTIEPTHPIVHTNPVDCYELSWQSRHGDADHDESIQDYYDTKDVHVLWFSLWLMSKLEDNREQYYMDNISKSLDDCSMDVCGYEYVEDYIGELVGYDTMYPSCYCGVDYVKIYYWDSNGVKYNVLVNGKEFNFDSMDCRLDEWFILTHTNHVDKVREWLDDGMLLRHSDIINANRMGLL